MQKRAFVRLGDGKWSSNRIVSIAIELLNEPSECVYRAYIDMKTLGELVFIYF